MFLAEDLRLFLPRSNLESTFVIRLQCCNSALVTEVTDALKTRASLEDLAATDT